MTTWRGYLAEQPRPVTYHDASSAYRYTGGARERHEETDWAAQERQLVAVDVSSAGTGGGRGKACGQGRY